MILKIDGNRLKKSILHHFDFSSNVIRIFVGKNPKPICISPPRLSNLKVCARFYDVYFPGRNFHFCLAMNGLWRSLQLFNMAFDCLRYGMNKEFILPDL